MQQEYSLPATQPGHDGPGLAYSRCPHPLRMFSVNEYARYCRAAFLCTSVTKDSHSLGLVIGEHCEGSNTCHSIYGMPQASNHKWMASRIALSTVIALYYCVAPMALEFW